MSTYTMHTRVHTNPAYLGKQGARWRARSARAKGCTGGTLPIERAPVPQTSLFGSLQVARFRVGVLLELVAELGSFPDEKRKPAA